MNMQAIAALHERVQGHDRDIADLRTGQAELRTTQAAQGATMARMETQVQWLRDRLIALLTASSILTAVGSALLQYWLGKH